VRENQSATQVNTIRQGKLASPLGTGEVKSVQKNGTGSTHRARKRVADPRLSGGWWRNGNQSDEHLKRESCLG
jgi:hypothetical protein